MRGFSRWAAKYAVPALAICALMEVPVGANASDEFNSGYSGRDIAFRLDKGNCLACHVIPGGEAPGNIGPPLIAMKSRYSSRELIRKLIWDPELIKPGITMPPFGKNQILSESEIERLVDFIWAL